MGYTVHPGTDPNSKDRLELPTPISAGVKWLNGTTEVKAETAGMVQVGSHQYKDCLKVIIKGARRSQRRELLRARHGRSQAVYVNTTEPRLVVELTLDKYEP